MLRFIFCLLFIMYLYCDITCVKTVARSRDKLWFSLTKVENPTSAKVFCSWDSFRCKGIWSPEMIGILTLCFSSKYLYNPNPFELSSLYKMKNFLQIQICWKKMFQTTEILVSALLARVAFLKRLSNDLYVYLRILQMLMRYSRTRSTLSSYLMLYRLFGFERDTR